MASKATTDEEDNAVDYQAVAAARIRDAVAEVNTDRFVDIDDLAVHKQHNDNLVVEAVSDLPADELFDLDNIKTEIINAVMQSNASVRLRKFNSGRHYVRFAVDQ